MLLSHLAEGNHPPKLLTSHLQNVAQKCKDEILNLSLDLQSLITHEKLAELSYQIGNFHDLGKASSFFQRRVNGGRRNDNRGNHAMISALTAFEALKEDDYDEVYRAIAFMVIVRHHGALNDFSDIYNQFQAGVYSYVSEIASDILQTGLSEIKELYPMDLVPVLRKISDQKGFTEIWEKLNTCFETLVDKENILHFFIANLLFSLLIDSDKKDAARLENDYFDGNLDDDILNPFPFIESLRKDNPEKFSPDSKINRQRNRFLKRIDTHPEISRENHLYLITAPTGIGKTFGAIAFANRLKSKLDKGKGRLIYCLPYTSIIEQNYDEFEKVIYHNCKAKYDKRPSRYLIKHHHLSLKKIENRIDAEDYNYEEYSKDILFVESWESAVVVTTFVQLFHSIFGIQNRLLKKFHRITGSIIVMDEVQNIDPKYYPLIGKGLKILGKCFDCYFLLITATQPEIFNKKDGAVEIINDEDFMQEEIFNRVKLNIYQDTKTIPEFAKGFINEFKGNNALIVMNTKKSAFSLCKILEDHPSYKDYKIFCLTTLLIPIDRQNIIEEIKSLLKNGNKVMVVSTQLVEAGVDFSFKTVYRDYAPLDSVIQTAGRCNRNGEFGVCGGELNLIHLKEEEKEKTFDSYIYSPVLIQHLEEILTQSKYESQDFSSLSKSYYDKFDFQAVSKQLLEAMEELEYSKVNKFKLIEDDYAIYRLLILSDESAEKDFMRQMEMIHQKEMTSKEKYELELIKIRLKHYELSLSEKEFNNSNHDNLSDDFGVIHYSDINDNYSSNKGLILRETDKNNTSSVEVL
ncbi:MAG: hypothetical protein A2014_12620 [Spirochaetes bacterium GWF1_49_6]|nr:MAG: hypothetical protein A2014_12620 [Spirochaetes bacterium GWF1_49_6]